MFEKIKEFINKHFRKGKSGAVRVVIETPENATIEYRVIGGGGGGNELRPTKPAPDRLAAWASENIYPIIVLFVILFVLFSFGGG